jgi:hypothetical protein
MGRAGKLWGYRWRVPISSAKRQTIAVIGWLIRFISAVPAV